MTTLANTPTARMHRRHPLVVGGAVLAATVIWLVSQAADVELKVTLSGQPPMVIGLPLVVATALTASLAGWGLLAVLERISGRARALWTGSALLALVASFGPLATAEATGAARLTLALMHLAVAAVLIPMLPRTVAAAGRPS